MVTTHGRYGAVSGMFSVPITRADTEAATLGEISQVFLSLSHVLVDLIHALLHTLQLL